MSPFESGVVFLEVVQPLPTTCTNVSRQKLWAKFISFSLGTETLNIFCHNFFLFSLKFSYTISGEKVFAENFSNVFVV